MSKTYKNSSVSGKCNSSKNRRKLFPCTVTFSKHWLCKQRVDCLLGVTLPTLRIWKREGKILPLVISGCQKILNRKRHKKYVLKGGIREVVEKETHEKRDSLFLWRHTWHFPAHPYKPTWIDIHEAVNEIFVDKVVIIENHLCAIFTPSIFIREAIWWGRCVLASENYCNVH